jgi:hypothetical protein
MKIAIAEYENISSLYGLGKTIDEIGEIYGVTRGSIYLILKKIGVYELPPVHKEYKLYPKDYQDVVNKYNLGMFPMEISKIYGVSDSTIHNVLHKMGIKVDRIRRTKVYDDNAFSDPMTEEKAYWIGFLMADGNISVIKNRITLVLNSTDIEHLEKFKKFVKTDRNIYHQTRIKKTGTYYESGISLNSKKIKEDLMSYGVVPQKSTREDTLRGIENNRHFWRGMVDGDGSLGWINGKRRMPFISLCLSNQLQLKFVRYLNKNVFKTKAKFYKVGKITSKSYQNKQALALIKHLYENSNIYLSRKYNRFLDICKNYTNPIRKETDESIQKRIKEAVRKNSLCSEELRVVIGNPRCNPIRNKMVENGVLLVKLGKNGRKDFYLPEQTH